MSDKKDPIKAAAEKLAAARKAQHHYATTPEPSPENADELADFLAGRAQANIDVRVADQNFFKAVEAAAQAALSE